jgi:hypothetical protein
MSAGPEFGGTAASEPGRKRGWIMAVAAAATTAGLGFALWLGAWAFDVRRYTQHVGRLERLQATDPTPRLALVVQAFEEEGTPLLAAADDEATLRAIAERYAGERSAEVLEKGRRWPRVRVFQAPDMLYVLYFDAEGVMRGFTVVSR